MKHSKLLVSLICALSLIGGIGSVIQMAVETTAAVMQGAIQDRWGISLRAR